MVAMRAGGNLEVSEASSMSLASIERRSPICSFDLGKGTVPWWQTWCHEPGSCPGAAPSACSEGARPPEAMSWPLPPELLRCNQEGRVDEALPLRLGQRVQHILVMMDREHESHRILLVVCASPVAGRQRSSGARTLDLCRPQVGTSAELGREGLERVDRLLDCGAVWNRFRG